MRSVGDGYAELAVTSNFTFLQGGSHPEELVTAAAALGHRAVAITDTNTLAGVVRAHVAAKSAGVQLVVGSRVVLAETGGLSVLVYPTDVASYARLCRLLTLGKRRAPKGECSLSVHDLAAHSDGLLAVLEAGAVIDDGFLEAARGLAGVFDDDRLSVAASVLYRGDDAERVRRVADLCAHLSLAAGRRVPMVATNRVLYHEPGRRALQDVLTCIRCGCTIDRAGLRLESNAERCLKPGAEMARLFARYPGAVARTLEIAARASGFSLDQLAYRYPAASCPAGVRPIDFLREKAWAGAARRYPDGIPKKTRGLLDYELAFIEELEYETYFLTCADIVEFARSRGILCQGRGGAANSAVCYCLGITEVDPATFQLLFERFISRERAEPPDIDIDFEHERREEVLQFIYETYGRERAAMTAEVISYRGRSAVREVGKAMGLPLDCVDAMAKNCDRWGSEGIADARVREIGLNPDEARVRRVIELSGELMGFPRHLSQHVGGMVITEGALCDLVPIENAAMEGRTVIEWDKDDIDALGMLKVDCLGLGMLSVLRRGLGLLGAETERRRDEETECGVSDAVCGSDRQGEIDGRCEDISGSRGVAEGDGTREGDLSRDGGHARLGAVRADEPDAPRGGVRSFEYRGGVWAGEPGGPRQVPSDRARLVERGGDAARSGGIAADDRERRGSLGVARRNGSRVAGVDPQPPEQRHLRARDTPSLRLSVSPSLSIYDNFATIASTPTDPAVYTMISRADTVGVFQIESRAQMSMLPRLKPREFYDLVIEVAIVRPGPIQGGMVHPYLRRREGKEPVEFPSEAVREVLGRTLGVPLFQEQAMRLAIVAAGFTPDQADGLRKSMAAWKRKGNAIAKYGEQLIGGMIANGYERAFAERCFEQVKGFSEYGFPESHAASFAILVYVSAWLKRYEPAAFAAALLNSQPMGFYEPAQLVRDAEEHGVEVRGVDVNCSGWESGLEERDGETERRRDGVWWDRKGDGEPESWGREGPALRLGLRMVKGLGEEEGRKIERAVRAHGGFRSIEALWRASGVSVRALRRLAEADAFGSMGLDRQRALWRVRPLKDAAMPLFDAAAGERDDPADEDGLDRLPAVPLSTRVLQDYGSVGLSLKAHPVSFLRDRLRADGVIEAADLRDARACPAKRTVAVAGVVLCRQRPGTASGVTFVTLEDETGIANLVIWTDVYERFRRAIRLSTVLRVRGIVEREGIVVHVHAQHVEGIDWMLPDLAARARDFH